jgi:hypothetical protein
VAISVEVLHVVIDVIKVVNVLSLNAVRKPDRSLRGKRKLLFSITPRISLAESEFVPIIETWLGTR